MDTIRVVYTFTGPQDHTDAEEISRRARSALLSAAGSPPPAGWTCAEVTAPASKMPKYAVTLPHVRAREFRDRLHDSAAHHCVVALIEERA